MPRHHAEIVLSALLSGQEVEIDKYRYVLSDDNTLCVIFQSFKEGLDGPSEDKLLGVDMTLSCFIKTCEEKLTWNDVTIIGANKVLNDMGKKNRDIKGDTLNGEKSDG